MCATPHAAVDTALIVKTLQRASSSHSLQIQPHMNPAGLTLHVSGEPARGRVPELRATSGQSWAWLTLQDKGPNMPQTLCLEGPGLPVLATSMLMYILPGQWQPRTRAFPQEEHVGGTPKGAAWN